MRDILMIDERFSKWQPAIEKSATQYNFNVTNTESIEDGLEKLKEYSNSIDAVILGLSFSAGKMQGVDGILKIREFDDFIPVIILTGEKDDHKRISECIRLGANDYYSKSDLDGDLLFLQIEKAIQQSVQRKKLLNLTKSVTDQHAVIPFFYVSTRNENTVKGYFAYRLVSVVCASFGNKHETEYLCQLAYDWHLNFLNALTYYESGLTLRLRYLYKPGDEYIDTVLVLEFETESYWQAMVRFHEIQNEFDLFMQPKKEYGKTIFYFAPIVDEKDLKNVLFPFNTSNFLQFIPDFAVNAQFSTNSIGFSADVTKREEKKVVLPSSLKPEIKLDNFCENLFQQKNRTMVELVLKPVKLTRLEIDHLKELINTINLYYFTGTDKENAYQTLSSYLQSPSKCFFLEVYGAQESKSIGKNLISAISSAFFASATLVNTTAVAIVQNDILKKPDEGKQSYVLNSLYSFSNIVNVFKFPYPFSATMPGIRSYNSIYGYMPENLSKTGIVTGIKNIGEGDIPIKISMEDLRKHLYLLGQTGTGKTTVLYSMIMDRIYAGKGVCVIDPHGDLHKTILENIPENRIKDIIRFEPGNTADTVRINLLEYNKENPQEKSFLIDDLFNFFRQEYDVNQTMGPMFELFMKNSLLLLMDDPGNLGTIGDITSIFQNAEFRNSLLQKCKDKEVVDFWRETAVNLSGDFSLANFTPYITSKLNQLLINEYIRPIFAAKKSNIDFRDIIDNDKILLVSLSKGKIGKIGVNILGTIILSRIINAAFSRENIHENDRKDFVLFVDEFQNFVSQSIMYAMSESRKYRLSLVLANQTLGQLNESMKQSVLGNVGSTIFFRPGINDVDYIMPYFTPYLTRENVLTLPNYQCIGRFQIDNSLSLPFIFETIPPEKIEYFCPGGSRSEGAGCT